MSDLTLHLRVYQLASKILTPFLPLYLNRRVKKGKEDKARLSERYGLSQFNRPSGKVIWVHAASVGESQMMMPVVDRILRESPGHHIIFTTGTITSAELLAERLPTNALHQYAPADTPKAVDQFLDHWKPDLLLLAESEIWPNMLLQTKARNIPMILLNARMSQKSLEGWQKKLASAKIIFGCFDLILAADTQTANSLSWMAGKNIEMAGNLKDAAPALPVDDKALKQFKSLTKGRKIWCAASTHDGEEELVISAAKTIKAQKNDALLILAPRHPDRVPEIEALIKRNGLSHICYAGPQKGQNAKPKITAKTDVILISTIGLMGLVYRLAPISLIGGSLLKNLSGHNPLEPARLKSAIIVGQNISSFADTYMAILAFGGAKRILQQDELSTTVLSLMDHDQERKVCIQAAYDYASGRDAVLDYVWQKMHPILDKGGLLARA